MHPPPDDTPAQLSADFEQRYSALIALIATGERITIADAAKRTGIPADTITMILAAMYAVADETLKVIDPSAHSLH